MKKKLKKCVVFLLVIVFLSSGFWAMSGCNYDIEKIRESAIMQLKEYANNLPPHHVGGGWYDPNYLNGPGLDNIVNEGAVAINNALTRREVNNALNNTKRIIDAIPVKWRIYSITENWRPLNFAPEFAEGFEFFLMSSIQNVVYEISVDQGKFNSLTITGPLSNHMFIQNLRHPSWWLFWVFEHNKDVPEQVFIDIVLRLNDAVIGYTVIEVNLIDVYVYDVSRKAFKPRLLRSVLSQQIQGNRQAMDYGQVRHSIETTKNYFRI